MGNNESATAAREDFEIGEALSPKADIHRLWSSVHPYNRARTKGTVFVKRFESNQADARRYFDNGIKFLRQLRHPCVLQYVDSTQLPSEVRLFTERVQVLDMCMDSLSWIEIVAGLRSILEALVFLHNTARISHNAVCPTSILVAAADGGGWRLGGFEFARSLAVGDSPSPDHLLSSEFFRSAKPGEFTPPEDQQLMGVEQPPWARDAFGLGRLLLFAARHAETDGAQDEMLSSLSEAASLLTASPPSARPPLSECLSWPAFSNSLSLIDGFVRHIQTKTEEEKDAFFASAPSSLRELPPRVVGGRLCRALLSRYVMLDERAHSQLLPSLLQPAPLGLLAVDLFRETLLPECLLVLRVRDAGIRIALLRHLPLFARHLSQDQLRDIVLDEVCIGLEDADDRVVGASLRAAADLVSLLGADTVLSATAKARHSKRSRIFSDGTPKTKSLTEGGSTVSPSSSRACSPPARVPYDEGIASSPSSLRPLSSSSALSPPFTSPAISTSDSTQQHMEEWKDEETAAEWGAGWEDEEKGDEKEDEIEGEGQRTIMRLLPSHQLSRAREHDATAAAKELGSEFSVKTSSGRQRDAVDDLFAELAPDIKPAGDLIEELTFLAQLNTKEKEVDRVERATRLAFAAPEEEGEVSAWGEETELNLDDD